MGSAVGKDRVKVALENAIDSEEAVRGVVADEPQSDLQVSSGDAWERGSNSEIVARRTEI